MNVPLSPVRCLYRAMDLFGSKAGIICGGKEFTYAEFGERCLRLASALRRAGILPGERVAYLSFNNHQLVEGYFGVPAAQAVVMPLNVRLSLPEFTAILNHAGARIVFYESDFEALVAELRQSCPSVEKWMLLSHMYEAFLATGDPERTDNTAIDEDSTAELFYTSGSTGTPKGVMLTHRNLYLHGLDVALCYKDPDTVVSLHTIPLFHANGWGQAHASTLLGIKQVMVRRFEPKFVCSSIEQHRATDMALVPTMANALINFADIRNYDLSSLRSVMIGGAASSPELIKRLEQVLGCRCMAGYGLTETAPVLTSSRPKHTLTDESDEDRYARQAMAGWPYPGTEVRVVDGCMRDVPKDGKSIGEVVARGDHMMAGYYRDPEGTAAIITDGWLHTGDMAVWDRECYIHIVDRKKEIIISGGENISSLEVEKAIFAHPEVFECAVVAAPDETWGEVPVAVVVRKPGSDLTEGALLDFLSGRLGRFKMPRKVEFTEDPLPKTGTGKIRKIDIREKYWKGWARRVNG